MALTNSQMLFGTPPAAVPTGYQITRSLRFSNVKATRLYTGKQYAGNRRTWTMHCWYKKTLLNTSPNCGIVSAWSGSTNEWASWWFENTCQQGWGNRTGGSGGSGYDWRYGSSTKMFRDTTNWMSMCWVLETGHSTQADRSRVYINGKRFTDGYTAASVTQYSNAGWFNHTVPMDIGRLSTSGWQNADFLLADFWMVDGYAASETNGVLDDFGEINSDTGIWTPKEFTVPKQNSIKWSNYADNTNNAQNPGDAFLGYIGSSYASTASGTETTFDFTGLGLTNITKLRLYGRYDSRDSAGSAKLYVNGEDIEAGSSNAWITATEHLDSGTLNTIKIKSGSYSTALYAVEVDDVLLTDGGENTTNLKFLDDSSKWRLGLSSYERGTASKTILNSSGGYNADANASNLVLAIPGDNTDSTTCDVHQKINTSSSNKAATNTDVSVERATARLYGETIEFDGNDNLSFADHADWDPGSGDYCVEAWVYISAHNSDRMIVSTWGSSSQAWQLYYGGGASNNQFVWYVVESGGGNAYAESTTLSTNCVGKWTHVAGTVDGTTDKVAIYINGKKEGETSYSGTIANYGADLQVGNRSSTSAAGLQGLLNDVRVYKGAKVYSTNFVPPGRVDFVTTGFDVPQGTSTSYSDSITGSGSFDNNDPPAKAFDGNKDTQARISTVGAWIKWEPPGGIVVKEKLEYYFDSTWIGTNHVYVNDVDKGNIATGSAGWKDLNFTGTLTKLQSGLDSSGGAGNAHAVFNAIRVDHAIVADGGAIRSTEDYADTSADSPTSGLASADQGKGREVSGNALTFNMYDRHSDMNMEAGMLNNRNSSNNWRGARGTHAVSAGKWYFEYWCRAATTSNTEVGWADVERDVPLDDAPGWVGKAYIYYSTGRTDYSGSSTNSGYSSYETGDVIGCALDLDANKIYFSKNGVWQGSSDPANGTNAAYTSVVASTYVPIVATSTTSATADGYLNGGQRSFSYPAPSGFKCLTAANIGTYDQTIKDGSTAFTTVGYVGNATDNRAFTGLGFSPSSVCIRNVDGGNNEQYDVLRGATKILYPSSSYYWEETKSAGVKDFDADGFTIGDGTGVASNTNNEDMTAWVWNLGDSTIANTDGKRADGTTNQPADIRVDQDLGFSIIEWTPLDGTSTIGHGLGAIPQAVVYKPTYDAAYDAWHFVFNFADHGYKQITWSRQGGASGGSDAWASQSSYTWTSTVFPNWGYDANSRMVAWAFRNRPGSLHIGTYEGNGATRFAWCGFRPSWVMIKRVNDSGYDWHWTGNTSTVGGDYNPIDKSVTLNTTDAMLDSSAYRIFLLSNGFATDQSTAALNNDGSTYLYMAFAENPFSLAVAR